MAAVYRLRKYWLHTKATVGLYRKVSINQFETHAGFHRGI